MKRTPLKRGKPLRRKTRLRARGKTSYRRRPRDSEYMAWVRHQPCYARDRILMGECYGRVQADHAGPRGVGQKADDRTCIPLCAKHHRNRTDFKGGFRNWKQDEMRAWLERAIQRTQIDWESFMHFRTPKERP